MLNIKPIYVILVFIFLANSNKAIALNSEEALLASCSIYKERKSIDEDSVCYEYINGFIDGAILTDTAIIQNIKKEKKEFSSFFDRALKTRTSDARQQKKVPATYFAKFCLPEDESKQEIILNLVHSLNKDKLKSQTFKMTLYETMKRVYKC